MFVLRGGRQYCPDQSHDGQGEKRPATRAFWPLHTFHAAVKAYHAEQVALPTLDIDLGGLNA